MTKQESYQIMHEYFSRPGAVVARGPGGCMYRAPNGSKCAVGCQIPDELYDPEMEGTTISALVHDFPKLVEFFGKEELANSLKTFLAEAQWAHDMIAQDAADFITLLDRLATENRLEIIQ